MRLRSPDQWLRIRRWRRTGGRSGHPVRNLALLVVMLGVGLLWLHPEAHWYQRLSGQVRARLREQTAGHLVSSADRSESALREAGRGMSATASVKLGQARCSCAQEIDTAFNCLKIQSDVLVRALVTTALSYAKPWRCQDAASLLATCYLDQRYGNLSSPTVSLATVEQRVLGGYSDPFQALWACEFYLANFLLCVDDLVGGSGNTTRSLLGGAGHILGELLVPVGRPDMRSRQILRDPKRTSSILYCLLNWHRWVLHLQENTACIEPCEAVDAAPTFDKICTGSLCAVLFREPRGPPVTLASLTTPERPVPRACIAWLFDVLAQLALLADEKELGSNNLFALSETASYGSCWPIAQRLAGCLYTNVVDGNGGGLIGPVHRCDKSLGDLSECIGGIALRETALHCATRDNLWAVRCAPMVDLDYRSWYFGTMQLAAKT
jgi:hypothetical protein